MALEGKLREFSATEILQLIATQRKTGCLVVENDRQSACVFVLDGRIGADFAREESNAVRCRGRPGRRPQSGSAIAALRPNAPMRRA